MERLDRHYKRDTDDDELDALDTFYRSHRQGKMREYIDVFETNLERGERRGN